MYFTCDLPPRDVGGDGGKADVSRATPNNQQSDEVRKGKCALYPLEGGADGNKGQHVERHVQQATMHKG